MSESSVVGLQPLAVLILNSCEYADRYLRQEQHRTGSRQRGAEPAGCHAHLTAEDGGEMALIGEPGLLCNQREGLAGAAQQGLGALEPALDDVALRTNPD